MRTAVAVLIMLLVATACGGNARRNGGHGATNAEQEHLSGTFIRWEPVDSARGYAYFSVTNNGASEAVAKCMVMVFDEYGNFDFDYLGGQKVRSGATIYGKVELDVGEGSTLPHSGDVTDC
jgi:hypothetical protein